MEIKILLTGIGATAVMDLWSLLRRALFKTPAPDFGLVGRWIAYLPRGKFRHASIKSTPAVRGEKWVGWVSHYAIGIAFASILVPIGGGHWFDEPTLFAAMVAGIVTVLAPFLIMQPGMGAGLAASRTPRPAAARLQSLVTHSVFGFGLYIAAIAVRQVVR
jgi:hypothetical protein